MFYISLLLINLRFVNQHLNRKYQFTEVRLSLHSFLQVICLNELYPYVTINVMNPWNVVCIRTEAAAWMWSVNVSAVYRNIISLSVHSALLRSPVCCLVGDLTPAVGLLRKATSVSLLIVAEQQIIRLPLWISLDVLAPLGSHSYHRDMD